MTYSKIKKTITLLLSNIHFFLNHYIFVKYCIYNLKNRYCSGMTLKCKLDSELFTEKDAANIMKQVFSAVNYLHSF